MTWLLVDGTIASNLHSSLLLIPGNGKRFVVIATWMIMTTRGPCNGYLTAKVSECRRDQEKSRCHLLGKHHANAAACRW